MRSGETTKKGRQVQMAQQKKTANSRSNSGSAAKKSASATKKNNNNNNNNNAENISAENRRILSLILFFYGVFMLFVTFIKGAGFWLTLHNFTWGLFGGSAIIYAPLVIYISIMVATEKSKSAIIMKLVQGLLVILMFCALFQILTVGSVEGKTTLLKLKGLYNAGVDRKGGGLLSIIFGGLLLGIFKKVGATIIIILLTLFFFFMLSGWTLPQVWRFISKPFAAVFNAAKEENGERQQRAAERAVKTEKEHKEDSKESKPRRVDIAKYYQEGEDDDDLGDVGYESFATVDELEHTEDFDIVLPPRPFGPKPPKKDYFNEVDKLSQMRGTDNKSNKKPSGKSSYTADGITEPDFSGLSGGDSIEEQAKEMQQLIDRSTEEQYDDEELYYESSGQSSLIDASKIKKPQELPPISLLKTVSKKASSASADYESQQRAVTLVDTLKSFGVQTRVVGIHRGPSVTRYELQPAAGVKVSKITSLADDIALNLAAEGVRIEAPIPGKAAVGIELSNTVRDTVSIRELIDSDEFRKAEGKLCFAVGKNIEGSIVVGDIRKMPHLLIAGTTGSGKSVFTNSIIMNILYRATSDEVKLMLIDPKQVEFPIYNGIPHLLAPVITEPRKAAGALGWAVTEMTRRYSLFSDNSVREFGDYNELADQNEDMEKLAHIVIIIDELADLMMAASKEVEDSICRLAQLARAAGMHLIIATQSPRVDVVTGLIKANLPSRVALKVSNGTDSRIILDEGGAEKLLGNGDLLFKPVGLDKPKRIQGSYVSTAEIRAVVNFLKKQQTADYDEEVLDGIEKNIPVPKGERPSSDFDTEAPKGDDMLEAAIRIVVENQQASTSFLQRKLNLGYARAARIMDNMEAMGVIGPAVGAKPREVRMSLAQWQEREATR